MISTLLSQVVLLVDNRDDRIKIWRCSGIHILRRCRYRRRGRNGLRNRGVVKIQREGTAYQFDVLRAHEPHADAADLLDVGLEVDDCIERQATVEDDRGREVVELKPGRRSRPIVISILIAIFVWF